jgi:hypothetical protein
MICFVAERINLKGKQETRVVLALLCNVSLYSFETEELFCKFIHRTQPHVVMIFGSNLGPYRTQRPTVFSDIFVHFFSAIIPALYLLLSFVSLHIPTIHISFFCVFKEFLSMSVSVASIVE